MIQQRTMALTGFEIAIGGITSIPVTAGLIFLGFKTFGEKNLDTTKFKPKKAAQPKKADPTKETSKSKYSIDSEKESESKEGRAKSQSATVEKNTTKKNIVNNKKSLDTPVSAEAKINTKDEITAIPESKP